MGARPYLIIGHRGVTGFEGIVENTLPAFTKAFELGADLVELDVWKTRDDVLVVKHDARLSDNSSRLIVDVISKELRASDTEIPTLQQVVDHVRGIVGKAALYIDVKALDCTLPLIDLLRRNKITAEVIVGSSHPQAVENIKKMAAEVRTSLLFTSINGDYFNIAQRTGVDFIHPCWEGLPDPAVLLTSEFFHRCQQLNLGVITWHEERTEQIAKLVQLPVFAICTDQPQLLL